MLLTPASRAQRDEIASKLPALDAWLAGPGVAVAPIVRPDLETFRARWAGVDRGPLSDQDQVLACYRDFSWLLEHVKDTIVPGRKTAGSPGISVVDPRMQSATAHTDPRSVSVPDVDVWAASMSKLGAADPRAQTPTTSSWAEHFAKSAGGTGGHMEPADAAPSEPLSWLPDWLNPFAPSADTERAVKESATAWAEIEPKMATDPHLAKELEPQHAAWLKFHSAWQSGTKDVTMVNAIVDDVNAARRTALGIDQAHDPGAVHGIDIGEASPALVAGTAAEGFCRDNPDDPLCRIKAGQDKVSWCQLPPYSYVLPAAVCGEDGLENWFIAALAIGGGALVVGSVYAAYRGAKAVAPVAIPAALALGAPELLPAYAAYKGGRPEEIPEHLARALDDDQATTKIYSRPRTT